MGATIDNKVDENALERHQTDLILHQNLFDIVPHENVSTLWLLSDKPKILTVFITYLK